MLFLLVIGESQRKDLSIFSAVHVDRHRVQLFEFRNVFERYLKFDIREALCNSCTTERTSFMLPDTFLHH